MTALAITPAALHDLAREAYAALDADGGAYARGILRALMVLTDTTPDAPALAFHGPGAAALTAEEAQPAHARHLPAGPAEAVPDGSNPPAAAGDPPAPEAPPPAQAAAGRTPHSRRVSDADEDLLRELWPLPTTLRELHAAYNQRALRPLKSDVRFYERARRLGLPIPRQQAMIEAGHAVKGRGMVKGVWTAERADLLRARYPHEGITPQLLDALNALPGPPIEGAKGVRAHAHRLGLALTAQAAQTKGAALAAPARAAVAQRRAQRRAELAAMGEEPPEPAPQPDPQPGWIERLPVTPLAAPIGADDEKRDVFDAFDAGLTVRAVAADFGTPLSTLTNWHAEWKRSQKQAAA